MNNSKISIDFEEENSTTDFLKIVPMLRQRQTEVMEILEAIEAINASNYWKLLQNKVFHKELNTLQRRLNTEKEPTEMFRLQGQIAWAEKYSDLVKMAETYRNELDTIKSKLKII